MNEGQRVEFVDGVLQGEKATIVPDPESGQWVDGAWVWLRFDNDGTSIGPLGPYNGYAILNPGWFDMDLLVLI